MTPRGKASRWLTGTAGVLFVLSVAGWMAYIPPFARDPLRVVPSFAQIIYSSSTPDLEKLHRLPFARYTSDPRTIIPPMVQHSPLVLAVAPLNGRERLDTWVAVSVAGPRSVWLRWRLMLFPPAGMRRLNSYGSWPVWEMEDPAFPPWMRVRFSVAEGLWICAISDHAQDIYVLLDTLDGRRPSKAMERAGKENARLPVREE